MPRKKHWFPFSHDFNDDGDLWEFTDQFGDRAIRLWMEICSILDKTENHWEMTEKGCRAVFRKTRIKPGNGWLAVSWLLARGWLAASQRFTTGQPAVYGSPNYWKYHPTAEPETFLCDSLLPSFLPNSSLQKEKNQKPATPEPAADTKKLDLRIKAAADPIYQSDPHKFAGLVVWIKQAQKNHYSTPVIVSTLEHFGPHAAEVANWYPYLDKIIYALDKDFTRDAQDKEHERLNNETRETSGILRIG